MNPYSVLLIGGGGREHALAWKLSSSPLCKTLYASPGNPGIALHAVCVPEIADNLEATLSFIQHHHIALVVIGPEQPLVEGWADAMRAQGTAVFGPSADAARLEGQKSFAKAFMQRHHIPTASAQTFTSEESAQAKTWLQSHSSYPIVLKADGLAAGKGVFICQTPEEALQRWDQLQEDPFFRQASARVLIESFLEGEEVSVFAICDGKRGILLGHAQDHKRVGDGDTGLNTGGMGAYAPAPVLTPALEQAVMTQILNPTLAGMSSEGHPYVGMLYMGLMITREGAKVIEYNCRFGDPECQVLMPLLDEDLLPVMMQAASGQLDQERLRRKPAFCTTVVMASGGYPGEYETGFPITGLEQKVEQGVIFQSGTQYLDAKMCTKGGRVLCVTAWDASLQGSIDRAYTLVETIHFDKAYYRRDIGHRGLGHLISTTVENQSQPM